MKRLRTENEELNRVQDLVGESVEKLEKVPVVAGVLHEGITLTVGQANRVSHGLGKKPTGYMIMRRNANAVIWDAPSTMENRLLVLHTSATVTVTLWVF